MKALWIAVLAAVAVLCALLIGPALYVEAWTWLSFGASR